MCVTVDDYEDDEDEEGGPAAGAGAKKPLSTAKDTVGKLAEKASNVAGVSSFLSFSLVNSNNNNNNNAFQVMMN